MSRPLSRAASSPACMCEACAAFDAALDAHSRVCHRRGADRRATRHALRKAAVAVDAAHFPQDGPVVRPVSGVTQLGLGL